MIETIFKKVISEHKVCKICNESIRYDNKSEICCKCLPRYLFENQIGRKVERPSYEVLINELKNSNYVQIGKKYGVSDNCIRKWIKIYEKYN
jgi:hypothetical protein